MLAANGSWTKTEIPERKSALNKSRLSGNVSQSILNITRELGQERIKNMSRVSQGLIQSKSIKVNS